LIWASIQAGAMSLEHGHKFWAWNYKMKLIITRTFVLTVIIAGCATMQPQPVDSTSRVQSYGFSVLPPSGGNWYTIRQIPGWVIFGKVDPDKYPPDADKSHTFLVGVINLERRPDEKADTPDDLAHFLEKKPENDPSGNMRLLKLKSTPYLAKGTTCVQYEMEQEERNNPLVPGAVLTITTHGFLCRHPYSQDFVTQAAYSERYIRGRKSFLDETLKRESEMFLDDVMFTPTSGR